MSSSSQVVISKQNLLHNLRQFKNITKGSQIMSVVKSNAYGHGIVEVARAIEQTTDWFATVNLDEALVLRKAGIKKPILVLSYYDLDLVGEAIKHNISLIVYDLKQAKVIDQSARKLKKKAKIHLKVDIGTHRLGVLENQIIQFALAVGKFSNIEVEGVFSHLAASEEDIDFTTEQINLFDQILFELYRAGLEPKISHIACSAASLVFKTSHRSAIRLGIGLYGLWPSEQAKRHTLKSYPNFELKAALSWKTKIIQLKKIGAKVYIGYGKSYQTHRTTTLAVLPIGYAEGYDRGLSNIGHVLIGGKRCKILGRVCMNLTMVDVTDVKKVKVGDEVVLIGSQAKEVISADEIAKQIGTINYEVVARINPEISRTIK
ncbi:MAG: alanine racemase [Candidatus Doudnabacteria bacterium RIFCSPLOWO2_02_FULL_42_9]|uniref:Alanine racemase n=1 Tax=Candidatus Doudnabacteria bacterium RIFCSPHIGHO2_01_FULL_41_86 TaxID=1817821 RepID=A0A1F5N9D9_9BACT|nr:MAG: alanine racemase [Candidatus Doudnabacteria bacterium RIFCSPHIGHO2_01_FULL_41_86]OGE74865.1 MAG: alanine racemase [Candidatus Doudnabacteria bacterium RIFCSPHIGHO2_01_43_10]OGE85210.1 MAG: alanine racemase [Candidatus Doudnabacteria bacterium RIFCSPHIGHO2_12_FULL_42_22]OGE86748.1 MAG: alanine racemase [Candidatus Doudnabacteria bacterium RIFCSPHIGHO2_02_FULL_42_25]OGE92346.1 MAG: alanine racemase [Candidatus Doudnabacteria bacterium RIFCSPLOWO2_01_FULL_42_60]OGE92961.1 MAG: alanine rac